MFVIEIPFLNLDKIYDSKQVLRWIKIRDGKYIIPHKNKALKVEQNKDRLILSCNDKEFYEIWYDYFDCSQDYYNLNYELKALKNDYLKRCAVRGEGVRILKQDFYEIVITYSLAKGLTINELEKEVYNLCAACGIRHDQAMKESGRIVWYEFPKAEDILKKQNQLQISNKDTLIKICQRIVDEDLTDKILKSKINAIARKTLCDYGLHQKAADLVCLFGLGRLSFLCSNKLVETAIQQNFEFDITEFCKTTIKDLSSFKGLIRQYIYYNELNPPKEIEYEYNRKNKKRRNRDQSKNTNN